MRTSLLCVLLLSFMLVSLSEQGRWWRRARRSLRRLRRYIRNDLKTSILLAKALGKREAGRPPCPPNSDGNGMDRQASLQLLEKLHLECPKLGITAQAGLSKKPILAAFDAADENGDQSLDKDELVILETVLDAFEQCLVEDATPIVQ
eukprot:TRINITY_DN168838_c0_g1_i1.p1 TRINITY_DN168838_c0_g1~~TRINITY_DN168838_c0_g1_i1.p1  ORF type:complete len:148 (-),score=31.61 TRINITY_DN168838_c0_g1_i1:81-524(-)